MVMRDHLWLSVQKCEQTTPEEKVDRRWVLEEVNGMTTINGGEISRKFTNVGKENRMYAVELERE